MIFDFLNDVIGQMLNFTRMGADFVFGGLLRSSVSP